MRKIIIVILTAAITASCKMNVDNLTVEVVNQSKIARKDALITLQTDSLKKSDENFSTFNFKINDNGKEIPSQIQINDDGSEDIIFVTDLAPGEEKSITVEFGSGAEKENYKSRTYAELGMKTSEKPVDGKFRGEQFSKVFKIKVPGVHTDHDALFKYEGPGWESELVGYRFYLDWRNSVDIFGKKVKGLVLEKTGINDTTATDDSYHNMQDWGMDIFKVGNSLGIGTVAMMVKGKIIKISETDSIFFEILSNGPVKSEIKTTYYGWKAGDNKYDPESFFSIEAGSRLTKSTVKISGDADSLATGLAKYENTIFTDKRNPGSWSYIALYGKQSLAGDNLGIALIYMDNQLIQITEDVDNHIVLLSPDKGEITYYFCAAWQQEPGGITSEKEFIDYLDKTVYELSNKVLLKYN